jgi:hypothetical protein
MPRDKAQDYVDLYNEAKNIRSPYENDWRLAAAYCRPKQYSWWQTQGPPLPYQSQGNRLAYDNTGIKSLPKWVAILLRMTMPSQQRYQKLRHKNASLMRIQRVKEYYDNITDILFNYRLAPTSMLLQSVTESYASIGVYGMGPQSVMWENRFAGDRIGGLTYKSWRNCDIFILTDDYGRITHVFRKMYLNARKCKLKFGLDKLPKAIKSEAEKNKPSEDTRFEIIHYVCARDDYDEGSLYVERFPWTAGYISIQDVEYIGGEDGFISNPYLNPRTATDPDDIYGFSPALEALPSLGGISQMKRTMIKQAHKAVDPPVLAADDGVLSGNVDLRSSRITYGGVDSQGRRLVYPLEMGDFRVAEEMLKDERRDVEDSFFVTLFQLMIEKEMTATEVVEMISEKVALLAPTMGRLQSEDWGPRTQREIHLLAEKGILPDPPPEIIEERGNKSYAEYEIDYTSPMAKNLHAEQISGFVRAVEISLNISQQTQRPDIMDVYNFDEALPDIAEIMSAKPAWINSPDKISAIREGRAQAMQQQQILQQAPAIASVATAAMKNQNAPSNG